MRQTFEIPLDIPDVTTENVTTNRIGHIEITVKSTVEGTPCHRCGKMTKLGQGMRYASAEINGSCFEPKIGTGAVVKRSKVARLKAARFGASPRSKIQ